MEALVVNKELRKAWYKFILRTISDENFEWWENNPWEDFCSLAGSEWELNCMLDKEFKWNISEYTYIGTFKNNKFYTYKDLYNTFLLMLLFLISDLEYTRSKTIEIKSTNKIRKYLNRLTFGYIDEYKLSFKTKYFAENDLFPFTKIEDFKNILCSEKGKDVKKLVDTKIIIDDNFSRFNKLSLKKRS